MPDPLAPELDPRDLIQFASHHRVSILAGEYTLQIQQVVLDPEPAGTGALVRPRSENVAAPRAAVFADTHFAIRSERLHLAPADIHAVFPPRKSRGAFWHVFPHLLLERSTLPWERSGLRDEVGPGVDPPWLALLVFHQSDFDANLVTPITTRTAGELPSLVPGFEPQVGEEANDAVQVFSVDRGLLTDLLPREMRFSHHARRRLAFVAEFDATTFLEISAATARALDVETVRLDIDEVDKNGAPLRLTGEVPESGMELDVRRAGGKFELFRVDAELGTVLANRLPQPDARNVVHLVSVERLLKKKPAPGGGRLEEEFVLAEDVPLNVNLISLASWEFFCTDPSRTFSWLLEGLNTRSFEVRDGAVVSGDFPDAAVISPPSDETGPPAGLLLEVDGLIVGRVAPADDWSRAHEIRGGRVLDPEGAVVAARGVLFHRGDESTSELRLEPPTPKGELEPIEREADSKARAAVLAGYVGLPHYLREGSRTVSWYHGPFMSGLQGFGTPDFSVREPSSLLPAESPDSLLVFDRKHGMFDASYAAAWELGRMLTLSNTRVALDLFHWKRGHSHDLKRSRYLATYGYALPVSRPDALAADVVESEEVGQWFRELSVLAHVPFRYLVPDAGMLPPESIRFFNVDPFWLDCLRDGAFSVGGEAFLDDAGRPGPLQLEPPPGGRAVSGVLIRSEVVSGWPGLRVDGYSEDSDTDADGNRRLASRSGEDRLGLLRMERLSDSVLLCLFDGDVRVLDVHLKPETLHFGLDLPEVAAEPGDVSVLVKHLRNAEGVEIPASIDSGEIPWRTDDPGEEPQSGRRIVDFMEMARLVAARLRQVNGVFLAGETRDELPNAAAFALEMVSGAELVRFFRHREGGAR